MVHVQAVKSVWSTLHQVMLQIVGNKQREMKESVLCLEVEEEENRAAQRTYEKCSLNFLKQFAAHTKHSSSHNHPLLSTILIQSLYDKFKFSKVI